MTSTITRTLRDNAGRRARRRALSEARLQEQRQRPLPVWLANRTARRALALVPVATVVAGFLLATVGDGLDPAVISVAVALAAGAATTLSRATRMLDGVPDVLLDEREISDRDHAYRRAFRLAVLLLGALAVFAVLDGFLARESGAHLVDVGSWTVLLVASVLAATMLPAAVLAWTWREPLGDADDL